MCKLHARTAKVADCGAETRSAGCVCVLTVALFASKPDRSDFRVHTTRIFSLERVRERANMPDVCASTLFSFNRGSLIIIRSMVCVDSMDSCVHIKCSCANQFGTLETPVQHYFKLAHILLC